MRGHQGWEVCTCPLPFTLCVMFVALVLSFITDLKTQMTGKVRPVVLHCLCEILIDDERELPRRVI